MANLTLFAIIDPHQEEQPALVRAADIARVQGAEIVAFCCVYQEDLSQFASRADAKRTTLADADRKVSALIEPLRKEGLKVKKDIFWNQEWFQSAVHASSRAAADLVIKTTFKHWGVFKKLSKRSDYYLLRYSTCPVLLTKSSESLQLKRVLAALAIEDGDNEHDNLNNRIVTQAKKMCRTTGADLHAVAALESNADLSSLLHVLVDEDQEKQSDQAMVSERFGIDADKVHVDTGSATDVIVKTTQIINADVLVIGTLGRSGVKGTLLGNTAEKLIDALSIDVLAIN